MKKHKTLPWTGSEPMTPASIWALHHIKNGNGFMYLQIKHM